jgi:hypothetical protein
MVNKVLFVVYTDRGEKTRIISARTASKAEKRSYHGHDNGNRKGQRPTKEQIKEIRAAAKAPIVYTADCPESTPEALAEFAAKARELRQRRKAAKPAVTIRVSSSCLSKYKSL